jgi:hypothetical protein
MYSARIQGGIAMDEPEILLFSAEALVVLDQMPYDPAARASFEYLSGGLIWPDEFPLIGSPDRRQITPPSAIGAVLAYRASITLGKEWVSYRPIWEHLMQNAPNWPGLRPERRGERALRRLQAALRLQDRCLGDFESQPESEVDSD